MSVATLRHQVSCPSDFMRSSTVIPLEVSTSEALPRKPPDISHCKMQGFYPVLRWLPVILRPYYACQDTQNPIYSLDMLWSKCLPALLSEMQLNSSFAKRHSC